jgi:hypothetical protein
LLDGHLKASAANLEEKDKCVLPMLLVKRAGVDSNMIYSLQPKSGKTDVDEALEVALQLLKDAEFDSAVFSYSTKVGLSNGNLVDALKTFTIDKSGLTVVFFTPFKVNGLFKRKVMYEKSIIGEVMDNILSDKQ